LSGVAGLIAAEGAELVHGAECDALVGGGLALDLHHGRRRVEAIAVAQEFVVVLALARFGHLFDERCLDAVRAGDEPLRLSDLFDEEELVLGGGSEIFEVGVEELVESVLILGVEDAEASGESMFERIAGRTGLAVRGAGSGAVLRVCAVSFDL